MSNPAEDSGAIFDLRRRAEEALRKLSKNPSDETVMATQDVLHELRVHQIELEIQNEELRRTQQDLEISRDRYFDLYDLAPVGYFTMDEAGLISKVNLAGAGLLQTERALLVGKRFAHYVVAEDRGNFYTFLRRTWEAGTKQSDRMQLIGAKGIAFPASLDCAPLGDAGGTRQLLVTAADITAVVRGEEEKQKTQRLEAIGILAGGIAHDFNNALTAVLGNVSLARLVAEPGSEIDGLLNQAERAVARARSLSQQLLTFSRGGAPVKQLTHIREMIERVGREVEQGTGVHCQLTLSDVLWPVEVDERQIEQVMRNLLLHAVRVTPRGGTVSVRAKNIVAEANWLPQLRQGSYLNVSVTDQGGGLSEDQLTHVFDPYFFTSDGMGGLGLAAAYSIIRHHSGVIIASSDAGNGTTFDVYLPVFSKEVSPAASGPVSLVRDTGKVLVMDDQEPVLDVASQMLSRTGYETIAVNDGAEAVAAYGEALDSDRPFDVVILDINVVGGMGGKQALEELLEIDPNVKAIVSSGYADDPIMADFGRYGFSGVISKPYHYGDLVRVVRAVLNGETRAS